MPNMADHTQTPNLPLALRLKLSIGSFVLGLCFRPNATVNRRLFNFLVPKTPPNSTTIVNGIPVSSTDVSVDPSRTLWFRLFVPATAHKLPFLIYFHGGGFAGFSPDSRACHEFCRTLAGKIPAVVASVNYRLTPEHKYPCQYDDGFDALQFIDAKCFEILPLNTVVTKCFLVGDSAGGNIAHHVALRASQDPKLLGKIAVVGLVAVQPFFGGEGRVESEVRLRKAPMMSAEGADVLWRMFLPEAADRNHPAVNVLGTEEAVEEVKRMEGFPGSMVIVGGYDPLQDWQTRYAERLKNKCGKEVELVEYPNAFHGFYMFPELPEFGMFVGDLRDFIHKHQ